MKKTLFKTVLICLGVTLLCGLYSFKTPEGVKSHQCYQTAAISNDTIITPDGEGAECTQEVVVEIDKSGCNCSLTVSYWEPGRWNLNLTNGCTRKVHAICKYNIYGKNGVCQEKTREVTIWGGVGGQRIDSESLDQSVCEVVSLQVCFAEPEGSNNQSQQARQE